MESAKDYSRRKLLSTLGTVSGVSVAGCLGGGSSGGGSSGGGSSGGGSSGGGSSGGGSSSYTVVTSTDGTMSNIAHQGFAQILSEEGDISLRIQPSASANEATKLALRGDTDFGISANLIMAAAHRETELRGFDYSSGTPQDIMQVLPWGSLNWFYHTYEGTDVPNLSCEGIRNNVFATGTPSLTPTFLGGARSAGVPLDCAELRDISLDLIPQQIRNGTIDISLGYTVTKSGFPGWWQELAEDESIRIAPYTQKQVQNIKQDDIITHSTINAQKQFGFQPGGVEEIDCADFVFYTISTPQTPENAVYSLVESLFNNVNQVQDFHAGLSKFSPKWCVDHFMEEIPVHPGAVRFFKENNMWDSSYTEGEV